MQRRHELIELLGRAVIPFHQRHDIVIDNRSPYRINNAQCWKADSVKAHDRQSSAARDNRHSFTEEMLLTFTYHPGTGSVAASTEGLLNASSSTGCVARSHINLHTLRASTKMHEQKERIREMSAKGVGETFALTYNITHAFRALQSCPRICLPLAGIGGRNRLPPLGLILSDEVASVAPDQDGK